MLVLQDFFAQWGYAVLFGLGFSEFIGVPIASVPFMVLAGGLAASGDMSLLLAALAVTGGGLLADAVWYWAGRRRGKWMVDAACGLTSNPFSCVIKVQKTLQKLGPRFILAAKFTPGAANLIAPAAGLAELPPRRFFPLAGVALFLWATLIVGLGWIFHAQAELVIRLILAYSQVVLLGMLALILAAGVWRLQKVRRHKGLHVRMGRSR